MFVLDGVHLFTFSIRFNANNFLRKDGKIRFSNILLFSTIASGLHVDFQTPRGRLITINLCFLNFFKRGTKNRAIKFKLHD